MHPQSFPLTYQQRALLRSEQRLKSTQVIPVVLLLDSPIKHAMLESAVRVVLAENDGLRSQFWRPTGGEFRQVLERTDKSMLRVSELHTAGDLTEAVWAEALASVEYPSSAAFRVTQISQRSGKAALLVLVHHVTCDWVAIGVIVKRLLAIALGISPVVARRDRYQPQHHAAFTRLPRFQQRVADQWAYWERELTENPPRGTRVAAGEGGRVVDVLDEPEWNGIRDAGPATTVMLLGAFDSLLARVARPGAYVGVYVDKRQRKEWKNLVSFLAQPVLYRVEGEPTFREVRDRFLTAYRNSSITHYEISDRLGGGAHRPGLFEYAFSVQRGEPMRPAGVQLAEQPFLIARRDLYLQVTLDNPPTLSLLFNAGSMDREMAIEYLGQYKAFLRGRLKSFVSSLD